MRTRILDGFVTSRFRQFLTTILTQKPMVIDLTAELKSTANVCAIR